MIRAISIRIGHTYRYPVFELGQYLGSAVGGNSDHGINVRALIKSRLHPLQNFVNGSSSLRLIAGGRHIGGSEGECEDIIVLLQR